MKAYDMGPLPQDGKRIIKFEIPRTIGGPLKKEPPLGVSQALEYFEKAIELGAPKSKPDLAMNMAICHAEMGEFDKAEEMTLELYDPEGTDDLQVALNLNLMTLYAWTDKVEKAESCYKKLVVIFTGERLINLHKNMASIYLYAKQYRLAFSLLHSAWKTDKRDAKLMINIGVCLAELRRYSMASSFFENAIEKEPSNASAYWNLGICYYATHRYGNAASNFKKARKKNPSISKPHLYAAVAFLRAHHRVEALDEFSKLLKIWPDPIYIKGHLADLHHDIGTNDQCRSYLQDIINNVPAKSHNFIIAVYKYRAWFGVDPLR